MKVLLVIDLQKEFKDNYGNYYKALNYIKDNQAEYDLILATLFVNTKDSRYVSDLNWSGAMGINEESLEFEYNNLIVKHTYATDISEHVSTQDDIDIIGCDTDACVLANAFKLWDEGYKFKVLTEYVYTTSGYLNKAAIDIMKRNFGDKHLD